MASPYTFVLLLCIFVTIESRTIRLKNIPITPEGISMRVFIKEDVKSGLPVATIRFNLNEGKKHASLAPSTTEGIQRIAEEDKKISSESINQITKEDGNIPIEEVPAKLTENKPDEELVPALKIHSESIDQIKKEDGKIPIEEGPAKVTEEKPEEALEPVPAISFDNRFGIGDVKCPKDFKRAGPMCIPR